MRVLLTILFIVATLQFGFSQNAFKVFTSRNGEEMPEEFATEIHVYEQLGEKNWHCVVYDVATKYRLKEYDCVSIMPDTITGFARRYWKGDLLIVESYFDKDVLNGSNKAYYLNGQLELEGNYENGVKVGTWKYYHPNGTLMGRVTFRNGEKLQWQYFTSDGKMIRTPVEDSGPEFPGGLYALQKFVSSAPYPAEMREKNVSGVVEIAFLIDSTGQAQSPTVRFFTDTAFAIAALEAFKNMPNWRPGYFHSRKVNVMLSLVFYFKAPAKNDYIPMSRELQTSGTNAFSAGEFEKAYQFFKEASYLNAFNNQNILYRAIAAINLKKIDEACQCAEYLYYKQGVGEAYKLLKYCDGPRFSGMPISMDTYIVLP
jgi:hypothetical protein